MGPEGGRYTQVSLYFLSNAGTYLTLSQKLFCYFSLKIILTTVKLCYNELYRYRYNRQGLCGKVAKWDQKYLLCLLKP